MTEGTLRNTVLESEKILKEVSPDVQLRIVLPGSPEDNTKDWMAFSPNRGKNFLRGLVPFRNAFNPNYGYQAYANCKLQMWKGEKMISEKIVARDTEIMASNYDTNRRDVLWEKTRKFFVESVKEELTAMVLQAGI